VEGPRLEAHHTSLIVEYDHQANSGEVRWARLKFGDVLAYAFLAYGCCRSEHTGDSDSIRCYRESEWLAGLLAEWQEQIGWHPSHEARGGVEGFSHFRVYFDEAGCFDVAAASCSVAEG